MKSLASVQLRALRIEAERAEFELLFVLIGILLFLHYFVGSFFLADTFFPPFCCNMVSPNFTSLHQKQWQRNWTQDSLTAEAETSNLQNTNLYLYKNTIDKTLKDTQTLKLQMIRYAKACTQYSHISSIPQAQQQVPKHTCSSWCPSVILCGKTLCFWGVWWVWLMIEVAQPGGSKVQMHQPRQPSVRADGGQLHHSGCKRAGLPLKTTPVGVVISEVQNSDTEKKKQWH